MRHFNGNLQVLKSFGNCISNELTETHVGTHVNAKLETSGDVYCIYLEFPRCVDTTQSYNGNTLGLAVATIKAESRLSEARDI